MVSTRLHLERLMDARAKQLDERWAAQREALTKAAADIDSRLHLLNELRGNVLSRDEYHANHKAIELELARIHELHASETSAIREALGQTTGRSAGVSLAAGRVLATLAATSGWVIVAVAILTHNT